jgi:acyl carrier protein
VEIEQVRSVLCEVLPPHARRNVEELPESQVDALSLEEIGLSSMQILKFMMAVEETLGIEFSDTDLGSFPKLAFGAIVDLVSSATNSQVDSAAISDGKTGSDESV